MWYNFNSKLSKTRPGENLGGFEEKNHIIGDDPSMTTGDFTNNNNDDFFAQLDKFLSFEAIRAWIKLEGKTFNWINEYLRQKQETLSPKEFNAFLEENGLDPQDVAKRIQIAKTTKEIETEQLGSIMTAKLAAPSLEETREELSTTEEINQKTAGEAIKVKRKKAREQRAQQRKQLKERGGELKRVGGSACPKLRLEVWLDERFLEIERELKKVLAEVGGSIPRMLEALVNAYKEMSQRVNTPNQAQPSESETGIDEREKAKDEFLEYVEQQSNRVIEQARLEEMLV